MTEHELTDQQRQQDARRAAVEECEQLHEALSEKAAAFMATLEALEAAVAAKPWSEVFTSDLTPAEDVYVKDRGIELRRLHLHGLAISGMGIVVAVNKLLAAEGELSAIDCPLLCKEGELP